MFLHCNYGSIALEISMHLFLNLDVCFMLDSIPSEIMKNLAEIERLSKLGSLNQTCALSLKAILEASNNDPGTLEILYQQVTDVFEKRWAAAIHDSMYASYDYTRLTSGINGLWIHLAHKFAAIFSKTYLQILMPSVLNKFDCPSSCELSTCTDLTNFFLMEGGKALGMISSLDMTWNTKGYLCVTEKDKYGGLIERPLSLIEIYRINAKASLGDANLSAQFALKLRQTVMRSWRNQGYISPSVHLLLLEIVSCYFDENRRGAIDGLLQKLAQLLKQSDFHDVYYLYGSVLEISTQQGHNANCLIVDLLIQCARGNLKNIQPKMEAFVGFLLRYNPSCIIKSESLQSKYKEYGVADGFTSEVLACWLCELLKHEPASTNIANSLQILYTRTKAHTLTTAEAVLQLELIYKARWDEIIGSALDYSQQQQGVNEAWIHLAQRLSGAKLIKGNYFRFLMYTIVHNTDMLTYEPLTDYPLSFYVLSENGTRLHSLVNSVKHWKQTRVFLNCSVPVFAAFTPLEERRLLFANQRFHEYFKYMHVNAPQKPLSILMVNWIREYVNASLDEDGLKDFIIKDRGPRIAMAACALVELFKQVDQLPPDEMEILLEHRTYYRGNNFSVRELFSKLLRGDEDGCIASCGKHFAKLVMDFMPWLEFNKEIEAGYWIGIELMRRSSAKKVVSDFNWLDEDEAIRRNCVLLVSILTRSFNSSYWWSTGPKISWGDYSNRGDSSVHKIYEQLKLFIATPGDSNIARHTYMYITEGIVKQALKTDSSVMISKEILDWFKEIQSGQLFKKNEGYFDPKQIFVGLSKLTRNTSYGSQVQPFLSELILVFSQSCNESMVAVEINLKFYYFLQNFSATQQEQLLGSVKKLTSDVDKEVFYRSVCTFLVQQAKVKEQGTSFLSFFSFKSADTERVRDCNPKQRQVDFSHCKTFKEVVLSVDNYIGENSSLHSPTNAVTCNV